MNTRAEVVDIANVNYPQVTNKILSLIDRLRDRIAETSTDSVEFRFDFVISLIISCTIQFVNHEKAIEIWYERLLKWRE